MLGKLAAAVKESGFAFFPAYRSNYALTEIAADFGSVAYLPGVPAVQTITPRAISDAPPNIYSGNYGMNPFPLHTDLAHWYRPPRYLVLRCVVGSSDVLTEILDGDELVGSFGKSRLRHTLVQPRRPIGFSRPLLRLLDAPSAITQCLRWDSLFLVPATGSSAQTFGEIQQQLASFETQKVVLKEAGDTLVVDNWRVLHGRSAVGHHAESRIVERVYLGGLH